MNAAPIPTLPAATAPPPPALAPPLTVAAVSLSQATVAPVLKTVTATSVVQLPLGSNHQANTNQMAPNSHQYNSGGHVVTIHTSSITTSSINANNSNSNSNNATTTTTTPLNSGPPVPPTPPHTGYTRRAKLGDSRSTGRLHPSSNTHRSMTRLNIAGTWQEFSLFNIPYFHIFSFQEAQLVDFIRV